MSDSAQRPASLELVTYSASEREKHGLLSSLLAVVRSIYENGPLVIALYRRDLIATYRRSFLGNLWLFISPLIAVVSWIFLYRTQILKPGDIGMSYPAFVLIGTTLWSLFVNIQGASAGIFASLGGLLTQVRFPKEVVIAKIVLEHGTHFLISLVTNLLLIMVFGIFPSPWVFAVPFIALPLVCWGLALGLLNSICSIVAHDISKLIGVGIGLLFFVTPVIYSSKGGHSAVSTLMTINPLAPVVELGRWCIVGTGPMPLSQYLFSALLGFLALVVSWRIFYLAEDKMNERVG
jgi:lipopolysaccharide transport system permease protein